MQIIKYILLLGGLWQANSCRDVVGPAGPDDGKDFSKVVSETKSPDDKRNLKVHESGYDSTNCYTQVVVEWEGSTAGVYSTEGRNLDIKTWWKNNNTIIIQTRKEYIASHQKWKKVQFFNDVIKVEYMEK